MHYGPVVGADLDDDDSNSALSSKVALRSQCTRGAQARQATWVELTHARSESSHGRTQPVSPTDPNEEGLRCVIAVIRHGDRTPKQKMKMVVNQERFLSFLKYPGANPRKEIKLKRCGGLADSARASTANPRTDPPYHSLVPSSCNGSWTSRAAYSHRCALALHSDETATRQRSLLTARARPCLWSQTAADDDSDSEEATDKLRQMKGTRCLVPTRPYMS